MKSDDLAEKTVAELRSLAKSKSIPVPAGAKKAEIIKTLKKALDGRAARPSARSGAASGGKAGTKAGARTPSAAGARKKTAEKKKKTAAGRKSSTSAPVARVLRGSTNAGSAARKASSKKVSAGEPAGGIASKERVESAKYYTGAAGRERGTPRALPVEYGEERIVLLARDPDTVFCYWEVPKERLDRERTLHGRKGRLSIRLYDVTGVQFDGSNATSFIDQEVTARIGSWYFALNRPAHSFCAEIGLRSSDGSFHAIVRSNSLAVPPKGVSPVVDETWSLPEQQTLELYGIPAALLSGISSAQVQELMHLLKIGEISSPGVSSWLTARQNRR